MRAFLAVLAIVLTVSVTSAAGQQLPTSSYGEAVFLVSGRGWGHGVGMSQYGAYGQALAGRTHKQILAYYYSGTTIGKTGRKDVRVLLADPGSSLRELPVRIRSGPCGARSRRAPHRAPWRETQGRLGGCWERQVCW